MTRRAPLLTVAWLTVACSSGGDTITTAPAEPTPTPADSEVLFTPDQTSEQEAAGSTTPEPTVEVEVSVSIEPVSETGVPGIESDDLFCRAWSEFAGSYQALSFGWAVQGGVEAATLEVAAADILLGAGADLATHLPPELEADRQALTVDLTTPLLRRSTRAVELLEANGLDEVQIDEVGAAWRSAIAEAGLESESLAVELPAGANAAVEAAAATFAEQLPPIIEDPSLIVDVDITATQAYLFDNCPDRGVLGGNDRVDP